MKSGELRAIIRDIVGGAIRAGTGAPAPVAHSAHERLIGGFQQLHREGSVRGETAPGRRSPRRTQWPSPTPTCQSQGP
eukprot:6874063-Pyramimonas_sp.AAC.1